MQRSSATRKGERLARQASRPSPKSGKARAPGDARADDREDRRRRAQLKRIGITCVCFNLRKASRLVTKYYDSYLEETGLRSTQFNILATIALHENLAISRLAELLVMDRTTLTRNLKPLEKSAWIRYVADGDRRKRAIQLTKKGEGVLEKAIPVWEEAQDKLLERMGEPNSRGLLMNLWRFVYGRRYLGGESENVRDVF